MKIIYEQSKWQGFNFWEGACDTVAVLDKLGYMDDVWNNLEQLMNKDEATKTEINDFFWFEDDYIAEYLGFADWEELEETNKMGGKAK